MRPSCDIGPVRRQNVIQAFRRVAEVFRRCANCLRHINELDRVQYQCVHRVEVSHPPDVRRQRAADLTLAIRTRQRVDRSATKPLIDKNQVLLGKRQQRQVNGMRRTFFGKASKLRFELDQDRKRVVELGRNVGSVDIDSGRCRPSGMRTVCGTSATSRMS